MRKFMIAATLACLVLVPARAGNGFYGFGTNAYNFGYTGGQSAYQGYLLEPNGFTQAASAWGYYGFTYAQYGLATPDGAVANSYFENAYTYYGKAYDILLAYTPTSAAANEQLDAALAHIEVARAFANYARFGF